MTCIPSLIAAADDPREIRLALVLNGGVSLAIWIGGVVAEIDRARRAGLSETDTTDELLAGYRALLDLTGCVLRTDVIAGASAGGLNGCLLAAAIANGGDVGDVRDLWIDIGSFRSLLRSGLDPAPKSILKGDDYFLPEIRREFRRRCRPRDVRQRLPRPPEQAAGERVRLFVTGTDILGEPVAHQDDFGGVLGEREHRSLFIVDHDPEREDTPFVADDIADRMARIARSTASFPAAFEASFCRVGLPDTDGDAELKDMASFSSSRWVIDGGVLDNAPFGAALGAASRSPASGPVRRILCYVTPYGGGETVQTARRGEEPSLSAVLGAVFELPRAIAMTQMLEAVEEYRRNVQRRRASRSALLTRFARPEEVVDEQLLRAYVRARSLSSVDDVLDDLDSPALVRFVRESSRSTTRPRLRTSQLVPPGADLPWLPEPARLGDAAYREGLFRPEPDQSRPTGEDEWRWGVSPIKRSAALALDLLARTLEITPRHANPELLAEVRTARRSLSETLRWAAEHRERLAQDIRAQVADPPPAAEFAKFLAEAAAAIGGDPQVEVAELDDEARRQLHALACARTRANELAPAEKCRRQMTLVVDALLHGGRAALRLLCEAELAPDRRAALVEELTALLTSQRGNAQVAASAVSRALATAGFVPDALVDKLQRIVHQAPASELHRRLLALEAIQETFAPTGTEPQQAVDLIRINAEALCEIDGRAEPSEKLTGLSLMHFGAFYKRSWRANDWLWGRLDGVSRLVDILVDPWVLRLSLTTPEEVERSRSELCMLAAPKGLDGDYIRAKVGADIADDIRKELDALAQWRLDGEPPNRLEKTKAALRLRLQLLVAREELPVVARAAAEDVSDEHAAPDADGARWARRRREIGFDRPEDVADALRQLRIAETESFAGEAGADLLTRNAATTAAVAASTLSAKRSGLPGGVRAVPLALRGVLLALYGLAWSLTSPKRALKLVAFVALVFALAVIVWGLIADVPPQTETRGGGESSGGPPAWLSGLAKTLVAGGLLVAALRAGAAGIGIAVAFFAAYLSIRLADWPQDVGEWFDLGVKSEPVLSAAAAILLVGALAGLVVGRGPLSWLLVNTRPATRAAATAGIRISLLLLFAVVVGWIVDVTWNVSNVDEWRRVAIALAVVAVGAAVGAIVGTLRGARAKRVSAKVPTSTAPPAGLEELRFSRALVVGGAHPLAPVVRDILGERISVRHRGKPPSPEVPAEDVPPPGGRVVLVRMPADLVAAYKEEVRQVYDKELERALKAPDADAAALKAVHASAARKAISVLGIVPQRPQWSWNPVRLLSSSLVWVVRLLSAVPSVIRRLLLGPADDGIVAASKLTR
jgi:patatin-related protein